MADVSLNELACERNQKVMHEMLLKAEALLDVALSHDWQNTSTHVLHDYFWVINDLLSDLRKQLE